MNNRILSGIVIFVSFGLASVKAQPYYDPDILNLLNVHGCEGCHGGSGQLFVTPYNNIFATGLHEPVVVPFDSNSVIVKKLKGTAGFGSRMPQGGPFLSDSEIQVFVQWIMGGALRVRPRRSQARMARLPHSGSPRTTPTRSTRQRISGSRCRRLPM